MITLELPWGKQAGLSWTGRRGKNLMTTLGRPRGSQGNHGQEGKGAVTMGTAMAGPMDGVWMGEYVCPQGKTTLALTITESPTGGADAIFQFSGHPMNPGVPMGSFQMKAAMDPFSGALVFKPVK